MYNISINMKQARPWMLANLKIICQFHAHPVHQNSVEIFWAEIYRGRLFLGSIAIVPIEDAVLFELTSTQKKNFLSVCQKRFNKIWKYQYK